MKKSKGKLLAKTSKSKAENLLACNETSIV